ncbi:hypothetical protein PSTG_16338 [Puccinia striiformis f. sp. tritici PST-78]|uniref:Uncharacterized protein n=1 Tax=Puccinia striiformis f. sp. tritici PST-78 TaxID=1165861 RepID=A0A0L0UT52_9BASI|nr:hypothetical protein PSTG_16338 [Puccinia striiformis f. sp. tritici PST-78]
MSTPVQLASSTRVTPRFGRNQRGQPGTRSLGPVRTPRSRRGPLAATATDQPGTPAAMTVPASRLGSTNPPTPSMTLANQAIPPKSPALRLITQPTPVIHPALQDGGDLADLDVDMATHNRRLSSGESEVSDNESEREDTNYDSAQPASPIVDGVTPTTAITAFRDALGLDDQAFVSAQVLASVIAVEPSLASAMMFQHINEALAQIRLALNDNGDSYNQPQVPITDPGSPFSYATTVREYLRTTIRNQVLLTDLHSYGATRTFTSRAAIIDARPAHWQRSCLPPGYADNNLEAIASVDKLLRELLRYEKSALAKIVLTGARPGSRTVPQAMPKLEDMIVKMLREMSPRHKLMSRPRIVATITQGMRIRMAYLRFHMIIQRQADRTLTATMTNWQAIDRHLEVMQLKSRDYKVAYGHLLLQFDREVFDGSNTAADVALLDIDLPNDTEVTTLLADRARAPEVDTTEPQQGEIF